MVKDAKGEIGTSLASSESRWILSDKDALDGVETGLNMIGRSCVADGFLYVYVQDVALPCKGAVLQLDLDGTSSGGVTKKIKFSLKLMSSTTTQYEAEEGMTWEQWVNSSYNTDGFFIRTYSSRLELVDKTQNFALTITSTDTIVADKAYTMGPAMS